MTQEAPRTEKQLKEAAEKARVQQGDYRQAIKLYQQLRERAKAQGNTPLEADTLVHMGDCAYELGDLALGLDYSQQAQAKAHAAQATETEIFALLIQARTYHGLNQQAQSKKALQDSIELIPSVKSKYQQALSLEQIAFHAINMSANSQAETCLEQSSRIWKELNNLNGLAWSLGFRRLLYFRTNQLAKSLEFAIEVLALHQKLGNIEEELVDCSNIALLYTTLGEPEKAVSYLLQGLHRGGTQIRPQVGELQMMLSSIYANLGYHELALDHSQQALRVFEKLDSKAQQVSLLGSQSMILIKMGEFNRALTTLQQSLLLSKALKNPKLEADIMSKLGAVYQYQNQPERAKEMFEKALKLSLEAGDKGGEVVNLQAISSLPMQNPVISRKFLLQALDAYRYNGDKIGELYSMTNLGNLEGRSGNKIAAESFYRKSITLVESLRSDAGNGMSSQGVFFDRLQSPYVGYVSLLVEQGRAVEAFALVQKTKARGLLDLMASGKIDLSRQLTEDEREQERQRRDRCDTLSTAMVREAALNEPGSKKRFEATKLELATAERELALFQDTLYAKHTGLGQRRGATTVNLAQVAKTLPTNAALLEFAPLDNGQMALFVVTRSSQGKALVTVAQLAMSINELERHISALRTACTSPKKPWQDEAKWLYQALLAPAETRLRGKSQLILCPDRGLWDVPFAVLTDKIGTPLLGRFALSYANSATTWHAAQTAPRKPSASPKLLVVANPQFDAEKRFASRPITVPDRPITVPDRPITVPDRPITVPDRPLTVPDRPLTVPDRDLYVPRGTKLVDLPGTQREADALAKRFPSATVYTRAKAQESTVKQEASKFQRLHLASHAFVNDAAPLLSSVVLANPTPGSGDDGFLTAREIFELDLSGVELVVLSACNTARGAKQGGEGVMGLTWALFAAGCPTQVLSQWAADDSSTATLMTRFYDGLAKGQGKSAALRQAALSLRTSGKYAHPYFWAPFVLIGDPR